MNYYDLNTYCREKYGKKLYKLSLSISKSCPNRDGRISYGGCIFCSMGGSGDFAEDVSLSVTDQIERAKLRVANKIKVTNPPQYIAYFQSFTSTYLPADTLLSKLKEAAQNPDIALISVATRPDCLGDDILSVLSEISKIKPLWVELGLQSCHNSTARLINRGYKTEVFKEAVNKLNAMGIEVIAHIIIGLPLETEEMLYETVAYLNALPVKGVKLQLLHLLQNTALAKMNYTPLTLEEYARLLCGCILRLRPDIVIHRISGDGAKKELIAPLWSGDKKRVLNYLTKYMKDNNITQGRLYK